MSESEFEPGERLRFIERAKPLTRFLAHARNHPLPQGERVKTYTAAVVTPPSSTMVCPVMKLEASDPR